MPLEAVRDEWERTCGPHHKQRLARYYGLYRDLFHGATFVPRVALHVAYAVGEEDQLPVYCGNEVTPTEVPARPALLPCSVGQGCSPSLHWWRLWPLPSPGCVAGAPLGCLVGVTDAVSPCQAAQPPEVTYEADEGSRWTLLLTNLGGCPGLPRPAVWAPLP